jgi:hypothetical protein
MMVFGAWFFGKYLSLYEIRRGEPSTWDECPCKRRLQSALSLSLSLSSSSIYLCTIW